MSKEVRVVKVEGATEQWSGDEERMIRSHGNKEDKHPGWLGAVTLAGIFSDLLVIVRDAWHVY